MFKLKSKFIPAFMLGSFLVASIALTSCNSEGEKAAEPAASETKMEPAAPAPAATPDTAKPATPDTTASTKPIKTAP